MALPGNVFDLPACTLTFLEGDVVHVYFKEERSVQVSDVEAMFHALGEVRHGRRVLLMVSIGDGTSMSNEARAFASSAFSDRYTAADAIIIRDLGHQLAANVFVRHHRPARPIRLFDDRESALEWLLTQQHLLTA